MRPAFLSLVLLLSQLSQASTAVNAQAPASVQGVVVQLGVGRPVVRAQVTLNEIDGETDAVLTAVTDSGGRFLFPGVQPGRYRLSATHAGYVRGEYGQRSVGAPGLPITLEAGQQIRNAVLGLIPTGAITGRVFDSYGDPVVNASVQALKVTYQEGRPGLTPVQAARTNDLGEYRLYWLQPGQYFVSAIHPAALAGGNAMVVEADGGDNTSPLRLSAAPPGASSTYLPVYFPGTTDLNAATPIDLAPGSDFDGATLLLVETRAVRIRCQVVDGRTGQAATGASVRLLPGRYVVGRMIGSRSAVTGTGSFEFQTVVPGSYDLVATGPGGLAGSVPIDAGTDIESLTIVLSAGLSIPGRMVLEGRQTTGNDAALINASVRLVGSIQQFSTSLTKVERNGTFTLKGVAPGDYRLQVSGMPRGLYVKRAQLADADILNAPLRVDGVPRGYLEIVVAAGAGTLETTVLDDRQQAASSAFVVLVPDPARRLRFDLFRTAMTDELGHARFEDVIPGDYKVFAWEDARGGAWQNPDFLRQYDDQGTSIRLGEGSREGVALNLLPARP